MSSIREGQRARKRKLQRCQGDTNTGIKEQQGSKKRCCGPDAQTLPRELTITINAPPKKYVVQHTERNTVCIGGCMFPLPEVERIQLGSLKLLQHEMETNAQMPVTFETLVSSKSTPELTPTDADVLIRLKPSTYAYKHIKQYTIHRQSNTVRQSSVMSLDMLTKSVSVGNSPTGQKSWTCSIRE